MQVLVTLFAVLALAHPADPEDKTLNKNTKLASLSQGLSESKTSKTTISYINFIITIASVFKVQTLI